ncbi:MAG: hypothetical protein AAGF11_54445 [Myxococcota bacterium]
MLNISPGVFKVSQPRTEYQHERDPASPVDVEQPLMNILKDFGKDELVLPGGLRVSLPSPDITFVFDEVDKVGTLGAGQDVVGSEEDNERARTIRVLRLLADLKNLLSSAPARFIFIGGRNLHDEWLADRTAQRPLLSTIFNAEIYIPSLLTDRIRGGSSGDSNEHLMSNGSAAYLNAQIERARLRTKHWRSRHHVFSATRGSLPLMFVQSPETRVDYEKSANSEESTKAEEKWHLPLEVFEVGQRHYDSDVRNIRHALWSREMTLEFVEYLTLRSRGNPKQLDALFEGFVRAAGHVTDDPKVRWGKFEGPHLLYFGDIDRFRISFSSEIYRRVARSFETRLSIRDDKAIRSLLQVVDFVMKFHHRAFSWSSLERLDEIVHIHRVPDLREIVERFIGNWHNVYLHPVLNGMYSFRFRSDVAAEIAYLSRHSQAEMASYNFTLDETQKLKGQYKARLDRINKESTHEAQEYHADLGELHDFEQEFEQARYHYRQAVSCLDRQHSVISIDDVIDRDANKRYLWLRQHMGWCIARIRLMLQVGMTYERSRNHERAMVEYREARSLARRMIYSFSLSLDDDGKLVSEEHTLAREDRDDAPGKGNTGRDRIDSLKHWRIVYQPLLAEAWLAEKNPSGVDTSVSLVERELWNMRTELPYVRFRNPVSTKCPHRPAHANFTLAMADLHAQTGDLYFWKGKNSGVSDGYLRRSRYHFCVALHEVRRFCTHRRTSALKKFTDGTEHAIGHDCENLPKPITRRLVRILLALGETSLASVSIDELPGNWMSGECEARWTRIFYSSDKVRRQRREKFERWLTGGCASPGVDCCFGDWDEAAEGGLLSESSSEPLVKCGLWPDSLHALQIFCLFSIYAAVMLEQMNSYDEAARAYVRLCSALETLRHHLQPSDIAKSKGLYGVLGDVCRTSLCRALELTEQSGQLEYGNRSNRAYRTMVGIAVMWFSNRALARGENSGPTRQGRKIEEWLRVQGIKARGSSPVDVLEKLCIRFPYPMLYRLSALRSLVLHWTEWSMKLKKSLDLVVRRRGVRKKMVTRERWWELNGNATKRSRAEVREKAQKIMNAKRGGKIRGKLSKNAKENANKKAKLFVEDLVRLDDLFDSPQHFTPMNVGMAVGRWAVGCVGSYADMENTARLALRKLRMSIEVVDGQNAYYEMLAGLHYLNDDFNDRTLHVEYALQLVCRARTDELARQLEDCLASGRLGRAGEGSS